MKPVRARLEPSLTARVVARTPLLYTSGADASLDRPAHVRAGSALAFLGEGRLAVVQDDASFLAVIGLAGRTSRGAHRVHAVDLDTVHAVPFPAADGVRQFDDLRGNKKRKLDLEASIVVAHEGRELLVAFGSGSSPVRERIVVVDSETARIVPATALYATLRSDVAFAGSELNIEGATLSGDDVVLFQRGNGAGDAVDATARIARADLEHLLLGEGDGAPFPPLRDVVRWDLGAAEGIRLTFTDATCAGSSPWLAFLACAEDCPDATRDGPVRGVSLGRLDDRRRVCEIAPVLDERGAPLLDKTEGLAFDDSDPLRAFAVVDKDDPTAPSELLELRLGEGFSR